MTHEERKVLAALAVAILINGYFAWRVITLWQAGHFAGDDGLALWAQSVIWLIPASIVANILASILLGLLPGAEDMLDERDRLIRNRGLIVVFVVTVAGILGAMTVLAYHGTALVAMNLILAGCAVGDLANLVTKLVLYRRGV